MGKVVKRRAETTVDVGAEEIRQDEGAGENAAGVPAVTAGGVLAVEAVASVAAAERVVGAAEAEGGVVRSAGVAAREGAEGERKAAGVVLMRRR